MVDLKIILQEYRKGNREFPTYAELAGIAAGWLSGSRRTRAACGTAYAFSMFQ